MLRASPRVWLQSIVSIEARIIPDPNNRDDVGLPGETANTDPDDGSPPNTCGDTAATANIIAPHALQENTQSNDLETRDQDSLFLPKGESLSEDQSLAQFMNRQQATKSEFAEAFERDSEDEPTPTRLLEEVIRTRRQMESLQGEIRRLQQRTRAGNSILFLLAAGLFLLGGWSIRNGKWPPWIDEKAFAEDSIAEGMASANENTGVSEPPKFAEQLVIDRRYMERIHQLYRQARNFDDQLERASIGNANARAQANEEYLQFMIEISEISEQAATEDVSQETRNTIVNIAMLAQQIRESRGVLPIETQTLIKQIESVIYPDGRGGRRSF